MLKVKTGDIITLQNHDSEKSCKQKKTLTAKCLTITTATNVKYL